MEIVVYVGVDVIVDDVDVFVDVDFVVAVYDDRTWAAQKVCISKRCNKPS